MPRVQPAEHLQGEGVQQVQELSHLDLPQLLRLLQAALLHPGEREEPGSERGRDGAQADPLLPGQDGLSGMLLQYYPFPFLTPQVGTSCILKSEPLNNLLDIRLASMFCRPGIMGSHSKFLTILINLLV